MTSGLAVVPIGGNTGLNGAAIADGQVMISLERMNRIREIRPAAPRRRGRAGRDPVAPCRRRWPTTG